MSAAANGENWRQKYFDGLSRLEKEQAQFRALEAALKKLAGRLCTAALGHSTRLDEQARKIQAAVRRDITQEELDRLIPALTEAIQALDHPQAAITTGAMAAVPPPSIVPVAATTTKPPVDPSPVVAFDDERIRAILAALVTELKRDRELATQADALDARLGSSLSAEQLADVLSSLTDMVGQRIARIERAREEIEALLGHMVGKLDEIGRFVADQHRSQNESQANSETLNVRLAGEMKAMGESVETANDLFQIRAQVRSRIDSIDRHLQEFRQRESQRADAMQARNEQMRSRITELEMRAGRLQQQLQDEQRLSTIDALTKVPNRLAYEKRVDEELKRWQRFRQPTCLAVWDVDRFKSVNDTYGHRAGDRVLRAVAECLASRIRATDFIARYGGEEFVMILPGTSLDDALHVADELRTCVASIGFHFRGTPISITISSGITTFLPDDSTGAAFDRADKALYKAKQDGRNRVVSG